MHVMVIHVTDKMKDTLQQEQTKVGKQERLKEFCSQNGNAVDTHIQLFK